MLRNDAHKGDNTMQSLSWIHDKSMELFEPKIHYMKIKKKKIIIIINKNETECQILLDFHVQ